MIFGSFFSPSTSHAAPVIALLTFQNRAAASASYEYLLDSDTSNAPFTPAPPDRLGPDCSAMYFPLTS